jgi:CBS domain-containing protein
MINKNVFWFEIIEHLSLQEPVIVDEDTTIVDAVKQMQQHETGCLLITNKKNELTGIVTTQELMHEYVDTSLPGETEVSRIMTKKPITIPPDMKITDAAEHLYKNNIRHFPVLKGNKIKGLLSVRVLMDFIAEHLPSEVLNLPPDRSIIPKQPDGG